MDPGAALAATGQEDPAAADRGEPSGSGSGSDPAPIVGYADLELGDASWTGAMWGDGIERALREGIVPLTACVGEASDGVSFALRIELDDRGAVAGARLEESEGLPDGAAVCLAEQAGKLSFDAPLDPWGPFSVVAPYTVRRRTDPPIPPEVRCSAAAECRLVTGGCAGPAPVHRLHAASVDARQQATLSVRDCAASAATPVRVDCLGGACTTDAWPHPGWNACTAEPQCTAVLLPDGVWRPVAAGHAATAVSELGARLARDGDDPPWVTCRYGACLADWGVTDPPVERSAPSEPLAGAPAGWFTCTADEECAVVDLGCCPCTGGPLVGARRDAVAEVTAKLGDATGCSDMACPAIACRYAAVCAGGVCVHEGTR